MARQSGNQVTWKHTTPGGTSQYDTLANGSNLRVELDPLGADIGLEAPPTPDTGGGEGDIGSSHFGGIMDARWSNFFDVSSGCSVGGVAASCSGHMLQNNFDSEMRRFFGDSFYDLPGNNNELGRAEAAYVRQVSEAFAQNSQTNKKKPKLRRHKKLTPKQKAKADNGGNEDDNKPRSNIHVVDFMTMINERLTIEHFTSQQESWIRYELEPMLTYRCSQAFPAGVNSPTGTILQSGLTIRPAQDLYHRTAKDLNLSERSRTDAIKQIFGTTGIVQGGTTFGLDGGVQIYLHDQAFQGETWWPGYHSLGEVLRHESIHGGGQPGIPYLFGHDLARWKYYKQIMQACSRN